MLTPKFSHIYIEETVLEHPVSSSIIRHFPDSNIITIRHYKDVFNRRKQNFHLQKRSPKLILATAKPPFLYRGAEVCENFGHGSFHCTSSILNCLFDCEYCYLPGRYTSANLVIFVNIEDILSHVQNLLRISSLYLCVSYDTDLLALDRLTSFLARWLEFAAVNPDLLLEIRTKSGNTASILTRPPLDNCILAWTLSPDQVIKKYEKKTPSLDTRLRTISKLMEHGWKIRLCFDPILRTPSWKKDYINCIHYTLSMLPARSIRDVSLGCFRMGKDYLKRARIIRPDSDLLWYPFKLENGVYTYPECTRREMPNTVSREISRFLPREKIYCMGDFT